MICLLFFEQIIVFEIYRFPFGTSSYMPYINFSLAHVNMFACYIILIRLLNSLSLDSRQEDG